MLVVGDRTSGYVQGVRQSAANLFSRLDSTGAIRWTRFFTVNGTPVASNKLLALPDGGALLACTAPYPGASTAQVAMVLRFDSTGTVVWQRTIGRAYSVMARMVALSDGSYALAGYQERRIASTSNTVRPDGWVVRITAAGDTLGSRYFGTPADTEFFTDVRASARGGLLLCGGQRVSTTQQEQGWLLQLDSLNQVQWEHRTGLGPTTPNFEFYYCAALAGGGALVQGARFPPGVLNLASDLYLAAYQPTGTGNAAPAWQRFTAPSNSEPNRDWDLNGQGELTISGGVGSTTNPPLALLRLQLSERPYVPNLCQTPPTATFGFAPTAGGDSLRFVSLSAAGPPHAQLVRWRWDFGDGTRYDGPTPPPHRFAGSGAGTAVRLKVTNNLGCTSTMVVYPFALATAAQRALQARLSVFPNPAHGGTATVALPGLRPQPAVAGELLNALGQMVRRVSWPASRLAQGAALELSGVATGMYTLRLRPQEGALVKRLLVQ